MAKPNYKQIFAKQRELEKVILQACPNMPHSSGIYFYTREDEDGKYAYIGKAVDLLKRSVSHLQGYQHIDISLRKRGFYSKDNENGWKLNYLRFPENKLDEKEQYYIDNYLSAGYELYNIESGGTTGKTMINERKPSRGYRDGLVQGELNLKRKLNDIINKYLTIGLKKEGKLAENALNKFWILLSEEENN